MEEQDAWPGRNSRAKRHVKACFQRSGRAGKGEQFDFGKLRRVWFAGIVHSEELLPEALNRQTQIWGLHLREMQPVPETAESIVEAHAPHTCRSILAM
jgi:hypothetical protein